MIQVKRKTEKPQKPMNAEEEIKLLKEELKAKDATIAELTEQVELVQSAVDEIIFGGAL